MRVTELVTSDAVRIERIVSRGHSSPPDFWYDQDESEMVLVVSGKAALEFPDKVVELGPGSYCRIDAHVKHRVLSTGDEDVIWFAVFYK